MLVSTSNKNRGDTPFKRWKAVVRGDAFILFAFIAFLFLVLLRRITDYDIWFHLTIGREIYRLRELPFEEFFVYTLDGSPAIYAEWGFGLLHYLLYAIGGYWGMSILNALVALSAIIFMVRATVHSGRDSRLTIFLACLLVWIVEFRFVYRPEMFLYLALAAELCILEAYRDSKRRLPLFIIPCIAAVLNNIHPSALILGIVLFFYGIDFTYQAALAGRNPLDEAWLFGALGVAALLFSAMNPYGFRQTLLPLALAAQTEYLRDIVEFYPAMQTDMKWLFLAILFLGMVSMLIGKRSNLSDWLMLFFFGYLGMRHVRNVALLAFAAFIPVSCGADRLYELIRERFRNQMRSITSGAALIGIALVSTATIRSGAWGAGVQPGIFPEETAVVMQQLRPQGRLFNHYATGGYLAWQLFDAGYPVFIDGRHFGLDRSYEEYLKVYSALPGWQDIIQRYAITSIALPPVEAYTGAYVPILIPICDDPAWLLAGREDSGMLFLKKGSVRGLEEGLPKRLVWEEVIREAHGVLEAKPNSAQAVLSIGIAYYKMKDFDRSAAYLREYLRKLPSTDSDAAAVKKILGEMPREQR